MKQKKRSSDKSISSAGKEFQTLEGMPVPSVADPHYFDADPDPDPGSGSYCQLGMVKKNLKKFSILVNSKTQMG